MIPGIINTPEAMLKVRVVTVKDTTERTLKTLHKIGVLHVEEAKELAPADRGAIEKEKREVSELLAFVNNILGYLPPEQTTYPSQDVEVIYTRPFSEISGEVRELYNKLNNLHEKAARLGEEINGLAKTNHYLQALSGYPSLKLKDLSFSGDYLFARLLVMPTEKYEAIAAKLKERLFESITATVDNETVIYAIGKTSERKAFESLVNDGGGRFLTLPADDVIVSEFIADSQSRKQSLEQEQTKLNEELKNRVREDLKRIVLLREALAAENERLSVLEKATESKYVTLIEGWIPTADADETIAQLKTNIEYVFADTRKPEAGELPPSKLKNAGVLKPFELIVQIFDVPKYGSWDPTPIVAYSFAFFFGIMLSDVFYGIALIAVTKFMLSKFVDDPSSNGFKMFKKLLYTSSIVGIVFGVLNGSYMGDMPQLLGLGNIALFPAVADIFSDPVRFVVVTIIIGVIHVDLGHLLGLIKAIQDKLKWMVLNKIGLFLLQIGGIPIALRALLRVDLPFVPEAAYPFLSYIMYASILIIIFTSIKQNGATGAFFWLFDISGFFGDAVSYCRLAGVGLASFYLAQSFNMILVTFGKIFPGAFGMIFGTIMGVLLFIMGHVLNTLLSGMGCFIHSLRLCFVEFLTKFYDGGGREYSPFKLRKKAVISVKS